MLEKTVRIRIDKHTRLRYVIIPRTGEVWIYEIQRTRWFKWRRVLHKLKPSDRNFVHYEYVQTRGDLMWNVIERAIQMSNERTS